ncbi:MAG: HAD-IIIA family hydrolase [Candidatus Zhuqueibacterota bacterium]
MVDDKIKTRDELIPLCDELRSRGLTIGFTSGAFDLLHAGHVDYLEKARSQCDTLIVALNSDASIRTYKGPDRPVVPERFRLKLVAALAAVDYVFLFGERRNAQNIEALKPHFYFKAGDYAASQLTSGEIVEKYGGQIRIIPVAEVISTTAIIQRILSNEGNADRFVEEQENTVHLKRRPAKIAPAIFLDRDGTINKHVNYLSDPDQFELNPFAIDGMKKMQDMGYRLVIVTNQAGIGMGYFSKDDFYRVNLKMMKLVSAAGIRFDKIYFCPHSKSENCPCRKPEIGLILRAQEELNIDLSHSYFVGDMETDIQAGFNAGLKTILIRGPLAPEPEGLAVPPDFVADNLLEAAEIILRQERRNQ